MLQDLLHLHFVFTVGEVLIELPRVLLVEDAILEDRHCRELVVAVGETIDELSRLRGGEERVRRSRPQHRELGGVPCFMLERRAQRMKILLGHCPRALGFHEANGEQLVRARLQLLLADRAAGELEDHPVIVIGQRVERDRHSVSRDERRALECLHLHPFRLGYLDHGATVRTIFEAHPVFDDDGRRLRRRRADLRLLGRGRRLRLRRSLRRHHLWRRAGGEQESREEDAFHASVLIRDRDQRSFLKISPPFMTKRTCSRRAMSCSGSPSTATMSAKCPADSSPRFCDSPRRAAATVVALWIACIGVMPYRTMNPNSFAWFSLHAKPPTSVPNEMRACLRTAFANACFSSSTILGHTPPRPSATHTHTYMVS